jgi:hypothetical protein
VTSTKDPETTGAEGSQKRRQVFVTPSMIAAARAQVEISRQLGREVPKVVQKIAEVGRDQQVRG